MEAEEVGEGEGSLITSQMDDFTVETSLEDLEFGFSVTSSTQKVSHISRFYEPLSYHRHKDVSNPSASQEEILEQQPKHNTLFLFFVCLHSTFGSHGYCPMTSHSPPPPPPPPLLFFPLLFLTSLSNSSHLSRALGPKFYTHYNLLLFVVADILFFQLLTSNCKPSYI